MDIVYSSLDRHPACARPRENEANQVLDILWVHAGPADGLEHASCRAGPERLDLLLFLLPDLDLSPEHRVASLLNRCHRASPELQRRYLPPAPPLAPCPFRPPSPASHVDHWPSSDQALG